VLPVRAAAKKLPTDIFVVIAFKILSYDNNLKKRCPNGVRVGIIGNTNNSDSKKTMKEIFTKIRTNKNQHINNIPIHSKPIGISNISDVERIFLNLDLNTLILSDGLSDEVMDLIFEHAKQKKVLIITNNKYYLQKGAAVGIVLHKNKPKILLHIENAISQGASFDARLVRLAHVVL
jgi:hypothetical protein